MNLGKEMWGRFQKKWLLYQIIIWNSFDFWKDLMRTLFLKIPSFEFIQKESTSVQTKQITTPQTYYCLLKRIWF